MNKVIKYGNTKMKFGAFLIFKELEPKINHLTKEEQFIISVEEFEKFLLSKFNDINKDLVTSIKEYITNKKIIGKNNEK